MESPVKPGRFNDRKSNEKEEVLTVIVLTDIRLRVLRLNERADMFVRTMLPGSSVLGSYRTNPCLAQGTKKIEYLSFGLPTPIKKPAHRQQLALFDEGGLGVA
jgi:hypothetical protein